jgi:hypothetical protein
MYWFCSLQVQRLRHRVPFDPRHRSAINKEQKEMQTMHGKDLERVERIVSTLAALGTFGFFFAVIVYGWYQAFIAMAS